MKPESMARNLITKTVQGTDVFQEKQNEKSAQNRTNQIMSMRQTTSAPYRTA